MKLNMHERRVQPATVRNKGKQLSRMFVSFQTTTSEDDCNSFRDCASLHCDDLLDVDQQDINVVTPRSSIHAQPCASISIPKAATECVRRSSASSTVSAGSPRESREKKLAQKLQLVFRMERTRKKLVNSMERSIKSRFAIKQRRLLARYHYHWEEEIEAERLRQHVYEVTREHAYQVTQDRISLSRRASC